jgi:hypothetical protein
MRSQVMWCIGIDIFAALLSIGVLYLFRRRGALRSPPEQHILFRVAL